MQNDSKQDVLDTLLKNEGYFEYDLAQDKLLFLNYRGRNLCQNKSIVEIIENNLFQIDEDFFAPIYKAIEKIKKNRNTDQFCLKAKYFSNYYRWYLVNAFERDNMIVKGIIVQIDKVLGDRDNLLILSKQDSLTGLLNKISTEKYIKDLISTSPNSHFAISLLDIDFFKAINDTYGHMFGDRVIKKLGDVFKKNFKNTSAVGRIGGDEFIIIEPFDHELSNDEMREIGRKIRSLVESITFSDMEEFYFTGTVGMVQYPKDGNTFKELYGNVDKALYRGKMKGRDCYIIFDPARHSNINVNDVVERTEVQNNIGSLSEFISNEIEALINSNDKLNFIKKIINDTGIKCGLDRIALLRNMGNRMELFYQYYNDETNKLNEPYNLETTDEYNSLFKSDSSFFINSLYNSCELDERYIKLFKENKFGSVVQVAVYSHGDFVGVFSYEMCHNRRVWQRQELFLFRLLSRVLSAYISNIFQEEL